MSAQSAARSSRWTVTLPAVLGVSALALALALPACAAEAESKGRAEIVAEVAGQPITMADLEQALAAQLAEVDRQRRKILEDGLANVVNDRLLATEAAARAISVEALLAAEVESKLVPIDDAAATAFYEENKARIRQPIEQMLPRIKEHLSTQQRAPLQEALLASLRTKYSPKILLEPTRAQVATTGSPARGPENAPVTIVEFSDFQCPFCSRVLPTIDQAVKVYGDQVRVVFRQFPLNSIHPMAQKAAEASLCANEQGKFWQLHDAMFADQQGLAVDRLKGKAVELGIIAEQFNSCLDGGKFASQVATDLAEGSQAGVSGTPAMFVNGRFLSGALPFQQLAQIVDDELRRKGIEPKKAS